MIFIVEDDDKIRELVVYTFNNSELPTQGFAHPTDFWAQLETELPDMVLLDIMLPGEDGLSILKRLRSNSKTKTLPVLLLTAKDSEYDKVIGLNSGADDYVPKPFGMLELIARVNALLRRTESSNVEVANTRQYNIGELTVNVDKHIVTLNDENIVLTLKEFEVLCLLLENRDVVITRDILLSRIWGYGYNGGTRTVDVHIRTLRQKLGSAGDYIETVRGIGYKIRGSI